MLYEVITRLCKSPRISWYAPTRKIPRRYASPARGACNGTLDSMPSVFTYKSMRPSESHVMSRNTPRRNGRSLRRCSGATGNI